MKKKILIGSLLVLTLLLLMPSIPAIQQKIIEDEAYNDIVERLEDFNFKDLNELKSIESDNIQDFLQNNDLNNRYDSEKFQKFVNSETFKHFTSSDFVQTLLNNNYDVESKIDIWVILFNLIVFIFGLITWVPVIIFSILIAIPMILFYTIFTGLYEFLEGWSNLIIGFILSFISGFFYGISNWLQIFIVAIIWPFYLVYLVL